MPAPSSSPEPDRAHPPLAPLAEALLARADPAEPLLVRFRWPSPSADDLELAIRPCSDLDPAATHPVDVLLGFTAPDDWWGIGVVATGWAHRAGAASRRIVVAHLVARTGAAVTRLRPTDTGRAQAALAEASGSEPDAASDGRVVDLLRRTLGLATAPPAHSPDRWLDCWWLDRVVATVAAEPYRRWRWPLLTPLHPLGALGSPDVSPALLGELVGAVGQAGWSAVRRAAITGCGPAEVRHATAVVPPWLARWMDEGALARWLAAGLPSAAALVDAVRALLPDHLAGPVLDATGLTDRTEFPTFPSSPPGPSSAP